MLTSLSLESARSSTNKLRRRPSRPSCTATLRAEGWRGQGRRRSRGEDASPETDAATAGSPLPKQLRKSLQRVKATTPVDPTRTRSAGKQKAVQIAPASAGAETAEEEGAEEDADDASGGARGGGRRPHGPEAWAGGKQVEATNRRRRGTGGMRRRRGAAQETRQHATRHLHALSQCEEGFGGAQHATRLAALLLT